MAGVGYTIVIVGAEKLAKKLSAELIRDPVTDVIGKITLFLDREVKKATPVQTNRLRSSITSYVDTTPLAQWGSVGTNVRYASFVEYGTKKMQPRHMEGGSRVYGLGMFGHALRLLNAKLCEFLKDCAKAIEVKFGS